MTAKIGLATGANRERKTTRALSMGFKRGMSIVYVARTEKNILSTIETFTKYVDKCGVYNITIILGSDKICPEFDDSDENTDYSIRYALHCLQCPHRKERDLQRDDYAHISAIRVLDKDVMNTIFFDREICHKAVIRVHMNESVHRPHLFAITYSGFKRLDVKYIKDALVVFDEARHLSSAFSVLYRKSLYKPSTMSFDSIMEKYIEETKFTPLSNKLTDVEKQKATEYILKWSDYVNESHRAHTEARKYEELGEPTEAIDGMYPGEELIANVEKPTFKGLKKTGGSIRKKLKDNMGDKDFVRLHLLLENLMHVTNRNSSLYIDYITDTDKKNNITLVIREMEENGIDGSRKLLRDVLDAAGIVFFVDSTPYPRHFLRFWLGLEPENITYKQVDTTYKFRFVVEDTIRSLNNTWGGRKTAESFANIIEGIRDGLDHPLHIFCRSHSDRWNLKKHGIEASVARGVDVEGVQLSGYTLATGLPLQNISSENYLRYELSRMTGLLPSEAIKEYRNIRACQELVQESLRTANFNGFTSGSVWMSISFDIADECKKYWKWLDGDTMEFIRIPKYLSVGDKVKFMLQGLVTGTIPKHTETEERIRSDVVSMLRSDGGMKKNDIVNRISGDDHKIRKIIRHMVKENILVRGEESHGPGRPKEILSLNTSLNP